jgi:hypothetical protein
MTERHPEDQPGHLDIDAVSGYVDRDFGTDDLALLEIHISRCPECKREVLEIRATMLLLASLPQYEPRRSFCLSQEHARARRRRGESARAPWVGPSAFPSQAAAAVAPGPSDGMMRPAGWLPGLHAAALVVGALLLLVTVGDLTGLMPGSRQAVQPMQLAAPPAPVAQATLAPIVVPEEAEFPAPAAMAPADGDAAGTSAFLGETSMQEAADESNGTAGGNSASEGVMADTARAPRSAATVAAAAVTSAVPTAAAASAMEPAASEPAAATTSESSGQPSRMRIVQIALALLLAWLVVSIAGLRWVRRLR